jgi:hypothetical protein
MAIENIILELLIWRAYVASIDEYLKERWLDKEVLLTGKDRHYPLC